LFDDPDSKARHSLHPVGAAVALRLHPPASI